MPNRWIRHLIPEPVQVSTAEQLRSAAGAALGIFLVMLASHTLISDPHRPFMSAAAGASAVLLFALPGSPLAHPWPVLGSHLISGAIGVACALVIPDPVVAGPLAVGLAIFAMHRTHTLHPPGGAVALLPSLLGPALHEEGFTLVLSPIAINAVLLAGSALLINRVLLRRVWPAKPFEPNDEHHHHADPRSLDRVGITHEDLHQTLADLDRFVDVSEEELSRIYRLAGVHAYRRRMGEVTAADIMSRDVVSVTPESPLEEAWALLRYHRVKVLPVLDGEHRVVGVVGMVDLLKRLDLKRYENAGEKLRCYMRRPFAVKAAPRLVQEVMVRNVLSIAADKHIAELVPLLSDSGFHHLPVVDRERRLIGIVTQSDLIAALYAGSIDAEERAVA